MPTIDGIKYSQKAEKILSDSSLGPVFRAFARKKLIDENTQFLDDTRSGRDPKKHYEVYFSPNGSKMLNISGGPRNKAIELAGREDWTSPEWEDVYGDSRDEIIRLVEGEHTSKFYASDLFKAHHLDNLRSQIKVPKALLDELGVRDKDAVEDMLVLFKSDKKAGEKAAAVLVSRKKTRLNTKQVVSAVKKFFRM